MFGEISPKMRSLWNSGNFNSTRFVLDNTQTWDLAIVNSNVGAFGSSTAIPTITVNGEGQVTAVTTNVVIAPAGTLTGTVLASNVVTSSLTTVGTIGTGIWQGTPVALAYGGTNANLTASVGGIVYSGSSALAILGGTATADQVLLSGSSAAPTWSTATYPATTTVSQILYSSSSNVIAGLATANSGVLITSAGGVPSISSTLPTAVQTNITELGTITVGVWTGTTIAVNHGGTGQTTYTDGQLLIGDSSSGGLDLATLSAGTNITITNGHGTITINASSSTTSFSNNDTFTYTYFGGV